MEIIKEEFRDIPEFERLYQVSTFGRVKSLKRYVKHSISKRKLVKERILKSSLDVYGYPRVRLNKNGDHYYNTVHKLMHITFKDKFNENKPCIDHIDRDRSNNHIDNLRECTRQENSRNYSSVKNSTSKYLGVHWCKVARAWKSSISLYNKYGYLGTYKNEIEAAKMYDSAAKYYYKEFANLNFPDDDSILPTQIEDIKEKLSKIRLSKKTSEFMGVSWNKANNKWKADIWFDGKKIYLGIFLDEMEAASAYDAYIIKNNGNLNKLNFKQLEITC